jgi:D-alanine-D-alanine ligase
MKTRVAVLFGGRSGEHEVSLASAESIMRYIDRSRYEVVPVGITREGHWLLGGDSLQMLKSGYSGGETPALVTAANGSSTAVAPQPGEEPLSDRKLSVDVVFPVLHGTFGEDGTVQGLLELAGVPYVGAGVLASSVGMDKAVMKALFEHAGLPVPRYLVFTRREWEEDPEGVASRSEEHLGYPCFVKPANSGSSVGITKAKDRDGLRRSLELAARYDRKLVVEQGIDAREVECSVLGNDEPVVSVAGEIVPHGEFYDYRAKYGAEETRLVIPAPIDDETAEEIRRIAIAAFRAIDCSGMARVDFFLERETGRVYLNEINTIPGFTNMSMYPKLWEASGLPYPDLIDRLIQLALERSVEMRRNETSYHPE